LIYFLIFFVDKYVEIVYYISKERGEIAMTISDKVKGLLALCGKKQLDLAAHFGMSKQTMSNKFARNGWFAKDLIEVAKFCGCKLAFVMPDGQQIIIDDDESFRDEK